MTTRKELSPREFLDEEAKIRLPDVDEVIDKGHAMHGADDPELTGTRDQEICRKIVADFMKLKAKPNTPEVPYLSSVQSIAREYGRAITRRKKGYLTELDHAKAEYDRKLGHMRGSSLTSQGMSAIMSVVWRLMGPAILALMGFLFARVLGDLVPESVADRTGTSIPSIIMTLLFVVLGRWVSLWLYDRRRDKIIKEYDMRCYLAYEEYEEGKLYELNLWRQRLCEAWKQYTGRDYPNRMSYQIVMKADLKARRKREEILHYHRKSDVARVIEFLKFLLGPLVRLKNKMVRKIPV